MIKVLGAAQSRHLEECAVQAGARLLDLMENAGSAAVRFLRKKYDLEQKRCVVLCGRGNNGGDGFVAARRLQAVSYTHLDVYKRQPPARQSHPFLPE